MSRLFRVAVGVAMLAAVISCRGGGEGKPGALTIAVIPKATSHAFWQSIHAGAEKAAQELGVTVIWRGPAREDDRDSQVSEVEGFVSRGVSGIVLAPLDETALVAPVANARDRGIPVVIIDSGLKGSDYVSFVATDNIKGGRLAGDRLAQLVGDKGKVVMLRYSEGHDSTTKREQGFLEAIKAHPGVQVVSANQYGGTDVEGAYKKSETLLSVYRKPDGGLDVNGIFCPNESTTFAMMRVLQENGWAGKVKFVGFDASDTIVTGLKGGAIDALVVQDPVNMGYLGVKTIVARIKGAQVEARIDTGATVVSRDNMEQPQVRELIYPDLKKWLKQ